MHTLHGPVPHSSLSTHTVHPCYAQHPRYTQCMALLHTAAWAHTAWPCSTQQLLLPVLSTWDSSHLFCQSTSCPLMAAPCCVLSLTYKPVTKLLIRVPENALRGGRVSWNLITVDLLCFKHYNTTANTQHIILSAVSSLYILRYEMRSL